MRRQAGIAHLMLVLAVVIVGIIGFAGYQVYKKKSQNDKSYSYKDSKTGESVSVTWSRTEDGWKVSGTPPACPDPLLKSPADVSKATSILYPGQSRGGDYKPHGGLRFDNQKDNNISVVAPLDADLAYASRYIEMGEVQYMFDFVNPCGFTYRFDHLLTLDARFVATVEKLPPPKENDSRTQPVSGVSVKVGDTIATQIGMNKGRLNVFFDFGLYDMRNKNDASKDSAWAAAHPYPTEQHGVCWFDYLPPADEAAIRVLSAGDGQSGKNSDFCK